MMSREDTIRASVLVLLTALACRTALYSPLMVEVPPELTRDQVEIALIAALANRPIPGGLDSDEMTVENVFDALYGWRRGEGETRALEWLPEERQPGVIVAGYTWRSHYLKVGLDFDEEIVEVYILDSRNLNQTDNEIHKTAVALVRALGIRLEQSLAQMIAYTDDLSPVGRGR